MSLSLKSFIQEIRDAKTVTQEKEKISNKLSELRTFDTSSITNFQDRINYVSVLIYCDMLGQRTSFGQMEVLTLASSPLYAEKRIGYLGLASVFNEKSEVLLLSIQQIKKDINSNNTLISSSALQSLGNIGSLEMLTDLSTDIHRLFSNKNIYIRKRAIFCALRTLRSIPELNESFEESALKMVTLRNHSGLNCTVSLLTEIFNCAFPIKKDFNPYTDKEDERFIFNNFKRFRKYTGLIKLLCEHAINILMNKNSSMVIKGVNNPFLIEKIIKFISLLFERLYQHYIFYEKYYSYNNSVIKNENEIKRDSIFDSMFENKSSTDNNSDVEVNNNSNKKIYEKARKRLFVELVSIKSHISNLHSELLVNIENRLYTGKGVLLSLIDNIFITTRLYHLFTYREQQINSNEGNCYCNLKSKQNINKPSDKELELNFELPKKHPKILKCGLDILKQFLGGKLIGTMTKVLIVDSNIRFATLKILGSDNFSIYELIEVFIHYKNTEVNKLVDILDNLKEFVINSIDSSDISIKEMAIKSLTKFNFFTSSCFIQNTNNINKDNSTEEECLDDKFNMVNELEHKLIDFINTDLFELLVDNSKKMFVQKLVSVIVKYRIRLYSYNKDYKMLFKKIDSLFLIIPKELKSEKECMSKIDNLCVKKLYQTIINNEVQIEELLETLIQSRSIEVIYLMLNILFGLIGNRNTRNDYTYDYNSKLDEVGNLLKSVYNSIIDYNNLDSKKGAINTLEIYWTNIIEMYCSIIKVLNDNNNCNTNKVFKCGVIKIEKNATINNNDTYEETRNISSKNILDDLFGDLNI